MLYAAYDISRALVAPTNAAAGFVASALKGARTAMPMPFLGGNYLGAGAELLERLTRRYGKPEWGIESVQAEGVTYAVIPETVVSTPFCDLIRFTKPDAPPQPRMLVVAPVSGHYATLLRGTVRRLLEEHDVYVTDWKCASTVPAWHGPFGLTDYVHLVMRFLCEVGPAANVVAVCQPAPGVLAASALLAQYGEEAQPSTMVLMGGPIDVAAAPTSVSDLGDSRPLSWFRSNVISTVPPWRPGAMRRVYPGFLQLGGFMWMHPDRHIGEHMNLFRHLVRGDGESADAHRRFYDEYLSVMDLDEAFYLETVDAVFQRRLLPRGLLEIGGLRVDPSAISRTALFTVEGEKDDISAPGQTRAAHAICPSIPDGLREHYLVPGVGHYGIFNGRRWRDDIAPRIARFVAAHDRSLDTAPAPAP
jgi:poly(3-hydroxybutyrate) depolymerase